MLRDPPFEKLALLIEPEIHRMLDAQAELSAGADDDLLDETDNVVRFTKAGNLVWEPRAEFIGVFMWDVGFWRYWWGGKSLRTPTKLDAAFAEGQRIGSTVLTGDRIHIDSEEEANLIARVCAQLARATGVYLVHEPEAVRFYALFSTPTSGGAKRAPGAPPSTLSRQMAAVVAGPPQTVSRQMAAVVAGPPPTVSRQMAAVVAGPPPTVSRQMAAAMPPPSVSQQMAAVTISGPPRKPSSAELSPLASHANTVVRAGMTKGFEQAVIVVNVDHSASKGRFFVQIVASDLKGRLVPIDASRDVFEAAVALVSEDVKSGAARFRRLTVWITPNGDELTVEADVVA